MQLAGVGACGAMLPSSAAAQDDEDSDLEFEPPESFIGSEVQAIGADRIILQELEDDSGNGELIKVMTYGSPWVPTPSTNDTVENYAADAVLKTDSMDNRDHHMLSAVLNFLDGARNMAWLNGLIAFIEAVQAGKSESDAVDDTVTACDDYYVVPQGNQLRWWIEQINEMKALVSGFEEVKDWASASDDPSDYLSMVPTLSTDSTTTLSNEERPTPAFSSNTVELADGVTIDVPRVEVSGTTDWENDSGSTGQDEYSYSFDPTGITGDFPGDDDLVVERSFFRALTPSEVSSFWLDYDVDYPLTMSALQDDNRDFVEIPVVNKHMILWDELTSQHSQMRSELESYAVEAYGSLAAGEITIEDIVASNPMLLASEWSTEYDSTGHYSYAAAGLASLGASHDLDHEMHVELDDGTQLTGTLFVQDSGFSVNVGQVVDPAEIEGTVYFGFESASAVRTLPESEYRATVDGGEVQLNVRPRQGTVYRVTTIDGETVDVSDDQWVPASEADHYDPDASTEYTVDLSGELEEPITEVDRIQHLYPEDTGDSIIRLRNPFTILEAYNRDTGEPVDTVEGEEPTDLSETEVQFTEEDLEAFRAMMEELNDDTGDTSGDGGGFMLPDAPDWFPDASDFTGLATFIVMALAAVGALIAGVKLLLDRLIP